MKKNLKNILGTLLIATPFATVLGIGGIAVRGGNDPEGAKQAVEAMNFTDVSITGKGSFLSCGRDGFYRTKFSAVNVKGEKVDGIACSGPKMFGSGTSVKILNYKR